MMNRESVARSASQQTIEFRIVNYRGLRVYEPIANRGAAWRIATRSAASANAKPCTRRDALGD